MDASNLTIYRRRLPHWRMPSSIYFVTWRLAPGQLPLAPAERSLVASAIKYFDGRRYDLVAYVVMDDHIHALVSPLENYELHVLVHSWKSYTSKRLVKLSGRVPPLWQREYFDRIVRDEAELTNKVQYIMGNAYVRWPDIADYPWAGWGSWFL